MSDVCTIKPDFFLSQVKLDVHMIKQVPISAARISEQDTSSTPVDAPGACPDRGCLVYEDMENGSLAGRLQCITGTPPIPWFHRFHIAWEIVSALMFLHSTKSNMIIHCDLKPENVLLDVNLVSKIGDVGL
jgi:serine/threonine protein kinase